MQDLPARKTPFVHLSICPLSDTLRSSLVECFFHFILFHSADFYRHTLSFLQHLPHIQRGRAKQCQHVTNSPQDYLQKEQPGLRQIIEDCGGRYHSINNRQWQSREQVGLLLEKVNTNETRPLDFSRPAVWTSP